MLRFTRFHRRRPPRERASSVARRTPLRASPLALAVALYFCAAPPPAHCEGRVLVLSDDDANAYRAAFAAVDAGDLTAAQDALDTVADASLKGHVLARAFLKPGANPTYKALVAWLRAFPDQPYGDLIRAKAAAKRPLDAPPEPAPSPPGTRRMPHAGAPPPGDNAGARQALLDAADRFAAGDLAAAAALAHDQRQGPRAGPAAWQLGLIAFKSQSFSQSATLFDAASSWPYWDGWHAAATRYWAGRAHLAAGHPHEAIERFRAALAFPQTFYGQLAEAQLGRGSGLEFTPPSLDDADARAFVTRHREARRAAALAQIGRLSDVEQELRLLHTRLEPDEDRVFLDFADALAAPSAQLRAAEFGGPAEGWGYCPTMSFAPSNGFQMDRAALFAVTRQESRYSPVAVSATNARGLMQLLASTATDMDPSRPFRARPEMLDDPGLNMRLGQAYLQWLMRQAAPDGDLMKLFAAYNGGPGWLTRWLAANPDGDRDPLMMIEGLPRAESRDYAERVLSNMGLCRKRFAQESAEFDELASGKPARYVRLDR